MACCKEAAQPCAAVVKTAWEATPRPPQDPTAGSTGSQEPRQACARISVKRSIPQPPKRTGKAVWFFWAVVVSVAVRIFW